MAYTFDDVLLDDLDEELEKTQKQRLKKKIYGN